MKKLLITKRLTAFLWVLVLTLMPLNLMADNTPLSVHVVDDQGGYPSESANKAFDGDPATKWCGNIKDVTVPFVEVGLDGESSKLDYYYLYTGNDINYENSEGKQQRNPKEWKLYAKVNVGDDWTLISHVTDAGLPTTVSTRSKNYWIDAEYQDIEYNYFRFEILGIEQGDIYEVGEIYFVSCPHDYEELGVVCSICGKIREHDHIYTNGVCVYKGCESPYLQPEGEGTWASPYLIGNAGNLAWYRDQTRKNEKRDCIVMLTADIDMKAVCNERIGSWKGIYQSRGGTFDGDGHVLKNLYIYDDDMDIGLFSENAYGVIKNLGIESGSITAGKFKVGAICGINRGEIINCFNKISVTSTYYGNNYAQVGGICGWNVAVIERCYNSGNISCLVAGAGGICGESNGGTIRFCYNTGTVSGSRYVGGVCGYSWAKANVNNCYNTGDVSGDKVVGGICGTSFNSAQTSSCYNTGKVRANEGEAGAINGKYESEAPNNYYLDKGTADAYGKAMTEEQFASGEVAWLLNGSVDGEGNWTAGKTDGTQAWYQRLGIDTYPTLQKAEGNTVFTDCMNTTNSYNNTSEIHNFGELTEAKEPSCTEDGNIAYHQCTECNKHFDEEGNELAEGEWVRPASHKLGELIVAKEPTCTEAGNTAYGQCTDCHKYIDEEGNELAEGEWVLPPAHTFGSDDICTKCEYERPHLLSFTIEESLGGFSWEEPYRAFDGKPETKWCGNFSEGNPYIVLKNDGKVNLFHYYLYTGNDIFSGEHNRNPKKWILYAKEKASDEWTVISDITDAQLPTEKSARSNDYTIEERLQETYYKFFKFEIIGVEEGDIYEVGELCLMGYPCHHQYDGESVFCSICGDIKEHEHIYTDYIVTKEPTCTESGKKEHTCTRCEETETEEISPLGHTLNDDLKCTVCGYEITADCIIEYTATERLSIIWEGWIYDDEYGDEAEFDYTDKDPDPEYSNYKNFGEYLFGASAIKHEYDETTHKGRIICNAPVTLFVGFTDLRRERLTSITLPSTVTEIGDWAFNGCYNLTSITYLAEYSEGLRYWSDLEGCNNLQEIIVPYNSYADYVEAYKDFYCTYDEGDGIPVRVPIIDYLKSLLPLDDTKAFETPESKVKVDATLQRSFANDGWYSLCVPFSVSMEDSPFSQVAEFNELVGNTYKFTTVDNIEAGKAYIVKVDAAVANPTFKNVFITTEAPATDGDFIGVYSPTELSAGCKVIGSGTTVNPVNPGTMKGFRAYFPASAAGAKAMRFTVDDGEATVVQSPIEATDYKLQTTSSFNLSGQKVNENYRGIVVRNGKKVLVK